ncbi:hypothetical protein B0H34DRAFT_807993 [Crassisporium funariophilum]|nr:hypothetical protein B0H34DRAFT_807993 [Crassisporium funariophilum]
MAILSTLTREALPAEIQGLICQHSRARFRTLFQLCLVSRTFRAEAERVLYERVRLPKTKNIRAWCIALQSRPKLAVRVNDLILYMPPARLDGSDNMVDFRLLSNTLRLCGNLETLSIFPREGGELYSSAQAWILDGHTFRLRKLVNSYFRPMELWKFVNSQTALQYLSFTHEKRAIFRRHTTGPELSLMTLQASDMALREYSKSSLDHKVEVVKVNIHYRKYAMETETIVALGQFSKTLVGLKVTLTGIMTPELGRAMDRIVSLVALNLPNLKFLEIIDDSIMIGYPSSEQPLLGFPISLPRLERLMLRPSARLYVELSDSHGCKNAAERIMASLPSLKDFSLHILGQKAYAYPLTIDGQAGYVWKMKRLSNGVVSSMLVNMGDI